mmetsp:Transcript_12031/g.28794  ORF Transcript_12031/g.28794 Transcript_12031/m.28794 type:complete len:80 (+) Transcript_12031:288-527(+)
MNSMVEFQAKYVLSLAVYKRSKWILQSLANVVPAAATTASRFRTLAQEYGSIAAMDSSMTSEFLPLLSKQYTLARTGTK